LKGRKFLNRLLRNSEKNLFNAIYVETEAYKYPITQIVLEKYPEIPVVEIRHYKDVFNRTNQHFGLQKKNQALILAVKSSPFLYRGPDVCQNFGHDNFYYTSFLLNCVFDCEYCYLQGMYPSANLVAFVNIEDFKNAMEDVLKTETVFLAASYDTDLIAFNNIIPYLDYFYDFFAGHPGILVEVRTKCANEIFFNRFTPIENFIAAFSMAPDGIINKYETHTPSLKARIKTIKSALSKGFKVRICLDPVFINPDTDNLYEPFFRHLFEEIDADKILDVGYGFFRMSCDFFKKIEKQRSNSLLFADDYCSIENVTSYPADSQKITRIRHLSILKEYIKEEKIFTL
jgi:spore photoproduct lyase